jgi:hypothetical protein
MTEEMRLLSSTSRDFCVGRAQRSVPDPYPDPYPEQCLTQAIFSDAQEAVMLQGLLVPRWTADTAEHPDDDDDVVVVLEEQETMANYWFPRKKSSNFPSRSAWTRI